MKALIRWSGALVLGLAGLAAQAQGGPGYDGMGPGMMGGGPGYEGMGPGMMYGWDGRMGPPGRDWGMMGGYGSGDAMGRWATGYPIGLLRGLNLTDAQASQVRAIADATRKRRLELASADHDARVALRNALAAPRDRAAVRAAYQKLSQLNAQRLEIGLDAADQIDALLSPQQRETLHQRMNQWLHPLN